MLFFPLVLTLSFTGSDKIGAMRRSQGVTEPQHCTSRQATSSVYPTEKRIFMCPPHPFHTFFPHSEPPSNLPAFLSTRKTVYSECDQLERLDVTDLIAQG